jgi:hypothetical protein
MLLKYINSNRISVVLLISLLPVVYWIPSLFQGSIETTETVGVPLGKLIISFNRDFRLISSLIALLFVIVNGYLLIQLNTIHIFIPLRTQLPSFFYVTLAIGMAQSHQLTPALVSSTLMILLVYRIFNTYKTDGISVNFLDAGLLVSISSLIYFPALAFFFFLLAAIILLRPFIWREWTFAVLGLILPYVFLFSLYYLADIAVAGLFKDIADSFIKAKQDFRLSNIVSWSYILFFLLISSYFMASALDSMKIHARKFFLVFLVFFMFSVLVYLIIPSAGTGMVFFVSVPLAYLFSFYFIKCKRNWINELFFAFFLLLLLWQRIN